MQISRPTLEAALDRLEIRGLLHRKHGSGIYVSPLARIRRIGLVVRRDLLEFAPDNNDFFHLLFGDLRSEGRRREEMLTCYSYDPEYDRDKHGPQQLELDVHNGRVDALIISGLTSEMIDQVRALGVPCVYFTDNANYAPRVYTMLCSMIAQAVRALVQGGCRRIGLAYPVLSDKSVIYYLESFRKALHEEGVAEDSLWLMPFDVNTTRFRSLEASRLFYKMWTNSSQRLDGLLSLDDTYTSGVLHAMELLGLRTPQDLLVASHANKGLELFGDAEVIRLEFDPEELSRVLLQTVDDVLAGKAVAPAQTLPAQLRRPRAASVNAG